MVTMDDSVVYEEQEAGEKPTGGVFGVAFEGEDMGINSALQIKSKISIKLEEVAVDDIITSQFKKLGRTDTVIGLSGVVGEWGIVSPVHLLKLEDEDTYMVLDGLRRLFGGVRAGKTVVPAMVWDFEDKQEGKDKANMISLMINRSQKFTAKEMWEQMQILEEVNGLGPGLIEFLLQMSAGEAMKLKDVMLSDVEYSEIRNELLIGALTIEGAYKKLCAERKKENRLAKEDRLVLEGDAPASLDDVSEDQHLSVDAVKDLLDLTNEDVSGESLDDLNRSGEARGGEYVQDVNNRHPLDSALKQQVLVRDNFTCQCCGLGGEQRLQNLAVHHIIEVSQGGPDSLENLVVVCVNCHITIHTYAWGRIYVKLDELDEKEKAIFKNIFKYGNIIIEADKRIGRSKEEAMQSSKGATRHPFPGEGLKDNKQAFEASKKG